MSQFNETRPDFKIALSELVGGSEAWGTSLGIAVFTQVNAFLLSLPECAVVSFDYAGISRADLSFQREAVVETLRKHRPRLLFVASCVSDPDVEANLESALASRGESLLIRRSDGPPEVLGKHLPAEHAATLRAVQRRGEITSALLTHAPFDLESSTASARLAALWRCGLIGRIQGAAPSGGREYKYFAVR